MAAMPMLIPSADSDARTRRLRKSEAPDPEQVAAGEPGAAGCVTNPSAYHR